MEPKTLSPLDEAKQRLAPHEQTALAKYQGSTEEALGLDVALELYELYLNGHSCEEIQRVNKKRGRNFSLGQIVDAAVRFEWALRRQNHQKDLFDSIAMKVKQTQFESVSFTSDLIAAAHKQHGERIKAYLQSGNEADLGDLKITSIKAYQDAVSMLMRLTGTDPDGQKDKGKGGGTQVNVITSGATEVKTVEGAVVPKKLTPHDFHKLLEMVESAGDDE